MDELNGTWTTRAAPRSVHTSAQLSTPPSPVCWPVVPSSCWSRPFFPIADEGDVGGVVGFLWSTRRSLCATWGSLCTACGEIRESSWSALGTGTPVDLVDERWPGGSFCTGGERDITPGDRKDPLGRMAIRPSRSAWGLPQRAFSRGSGPGAGVRRPSRRFPRPLGAMFFPLIQRPGDRRVRRKHPRRGVGGTAATAG